MMSCGFKVRWWWWWWCCQWKGKAKEGALVGVVPAGHLKLGMEGESEKEWTIAAGIITARYFSP